MAHRTLPLFNDLLSAFNMSENELLEYFKNTKYERMLEISLNINDIQLTNDEIIEYIKFIDFAQSTYTDIAKHINVNNYKEINVEYNDNIKRELMLSLNFDIINSFYSEQDKNIWLEYNFKHILNNNPEILKEYLQCSFNYDYYLINGKILINKNLPTYNTSSKNKIYDDLNACVFHNKINVVKYLINNHKFNDIIDIINNVNNSNFESIDFVINYLTNNKINFDSCNFKKFIINGHFKIINIFIDNNLNSCMLFDNISELINLYSELKVKEKYSRYTFKNYTSKEKENMFEFIKYIIDNNINNTLKMSYFNSILCKSRISELIIHLCEKNISENNKTNVNLIFYHCLNYKNYDIIHYYIVNNLITDEIKQVVKKMIDDPMLNICEDVQNYLFEYGVL